MRFKSNGHAQEYWNGFKFVTFERGFYETEDPDEIENLLNCYGVEAITEKEKDATPPTKKPSGKRTKKDEPEPIGGAQQPETFMINKQPFEILRWL